MAVLLVIGKLFWEHQVRQCHGTCVVPSIRSRAVASTKNGSHERNGSRTGKNLIFSDEPRLTKSRGRCGSDCQRAGIEAESGLSSNQWHFSIRATRRGRKGRSENETNAQGQGVPPAEQARFTRTEAVWPFSFRGRGIGPERQRQQFQ